MSPVANESCLATFASLDALRKLMPAFETAGQELDRTPRSVFRAPDLGRYELLQPIAAKPGAPTLPAHVREALGWSPSESPATERAEKAPVASGSRIGAYGPDSDPSP
jgi:hypothetical protein